ncbi:MAG: LPS export ABC transporter ATP-binding protein [Enterobacteriaceae bacterium]|nr:LPS export ABC transporter ATP-binding protein [Enterobacteriaceae bacterium]
MIKRLEIKNLSKTIESKKILDNVSIEINTGQAIGILGPNGSGKTTLFHIIIGLIKSDTGSILVENKDITNYQIHTRAKYGISYLPQEPSIFRNLTVEDNIKSIIEIQSEINTIKMKDLLEELIIKLNIQKIRNTKGKSLSGGERRKVEIARCLATKPIFLLLDEPFIGIDPISIIDIKNIITFLLKSNIGIMITDHNVQEILNICIKSYIINNGKIIFSGSSENILKNQEIQKIYLGKNFLNTWKTEE